jgi:two-component system response regulator YesN
MRIIIAEDEQRTRQGLAKLISSLDGDYEVVATASNGQIALDLILQMKPDLVFVDIKMPFLDGLSLIRAIRARSMTTEFVVVTAYADFQFAQESIALGVAGYLLKPPAREEVEQVLHKTAAKLEKQQVYSGEYSWNLREKYPDAHPVILKALDMIQAGYAGKLSQKKMAEDLCVSPEYFSYLFAKNVGETFSAFVRSYRVEQAKRLYRTRECDRKEVPYAVGFSDAKYFNKVFREVAGVTPSEYLQHQRETES